MMYIKSIHKRTAGFTIIELMIATLVFSVILLIITSGIISLTNQYYKGVTSANTQDVARAVMDTIAQDIQFSSGTPTATATSTSDSTIGYFCTGNHTYTYKLGFQLTDSVSLNPDQSNHALVESPQPSGGCASPAGFPSAGPGVRELLTPRMRLANLVVSQASGTSNSWTIKVRVVSGDSDILNNPQPAHPDDPTTQTNCKSGSGSQFCAVSELTTTVEQRL